MKMDSYFAANLAYVNSPEATNGASNFINNIKNGVIKMEALPNSYEEFTGTVEKNDFISFCKFLESVNGQLVLSISEE